MPAYIVGAIIVALPAVAVAWLFLGRKHRAIFWFACALIAVGAGYLAATGAAEDIARKIAPNLVAPARAPATAR